MKTNFTPGNEFYSTVSWGYHAVIINTYLLLTMDKGGMLKARVRIQAGWNDFIVCYTSPALRQDRCFSSMAFRYICKDHMRLHIQEHPERENSGSVMNNVWKHEGLYAKEGLYVILLICGHCSCDSNMEKDLTHTHPHTPGFRDFLHIYWFNSIQTLLFVFPLESSTITLYCHLLYFLWFCLFVMSIYFLCPFLRVRRYVDGKPLP